MTDEDTMLIKIVLNIMHKLDAIDEYTYIRAFDWTIFKATVRQAEVLYGQQEE
jgi:hypothetical protein